MNIKYAKYSLSFIATLLLLNSAVFAMDRAEYNLSPSPKLLAYVTTQEQPQQVTIMQPQRNVENPLLTERQLSALKNPNIYLCNQREYKHAICNICKGDKLTVIDNPRTDGFGNTIWITTPCCKQQHYHFDCLKQWLKQHPVCPMCSQSCTLPEKIKYVLNPEDKIYFMEKGLLPMDDETKSIIFWSNLKNKMQSVAHDAKKILTPTRNDMLGIGVGILLTGFFELYFQTLTMLLPCYNPTYIGYCIMTGVISGSTGRTIYDIAQTSTIYNKILVFKERSLLYSLPLIYATLRFNCRQGCIDLKKYLHNKIKHSNLKPMSIKILKNIMGWHDGPQA